jgi:hypothetical protein
MQQSTSTYGQILRYIVEGWRHLKRKHDELAEFDSCGRCEVERIARDLGLTAGELRTVVVRGEATTELLHRRMETLGIDAAQIDPAVLRDLERACAACENDQECAHELDTRPQQAGWPRYCPNATTLEALSMMRCH